MSTAQLAPAIPHLATDGSDWHDSPIRDCREPCPVCGYANAPLQVHRTNPGGGWERIDEKWSSSSTRDSRVVWVPPPPKGISQDDAETLAGMARDGSPKGKR
jgi:rubredoxin